MSLLKFNDWRKEQNESSPSTRLKREIANGLRTPVGMGSFDGHATVPGGERQQLKKRIGALKKKGKKKKIVTKKKKPVKDNKIDSFIDELEKLQVDVDKYKKAVADKDKKQKIEPKSSAKPVVKPEEKDDDEDDIEGDDESSSGQEK